MPENKQVDKNRSNTHLGGLYGIIGAIIGSITSLFIYYQGSVKPKANQISRQDSIIEILKLRNVDNASKISKLTIELDDLKKRKNDAIPSSDSIIDREHPLKAFDKNVKQSVTNAERNFQWQVNSVHDVELSDIGCIGNASLKTVSVSFKMTNNKSTLFNFKLVGRNRSQLSLASGDGNQYPLESIIIGNETIRSDNVMYNRQLATEESIRITLNYSQVSPDVKKLLYAQVIALTAIPKQESYFHDGEIYIKNLPIQW